MTTLPTDLIGLVLLVLGAAVIYWVKRAKFQRIHKYCVERFPTFGAKLRAQLGSHIAIGASTVLLAAGTITLASNHLDSWGRIVMAPVVLLMLFLLLGWT
jgi:hypothetical protein